MNLNWDELTFSNDFLFCKILEKRKDLCQRIIEVLTKRKIKELRNVRSQQSEQGTINGKGVRFDIIFEDDQDTVYDLEMQTTDQSNLPKRSRYYQSALDTSFLEKGHDYDELPKTLIIFICTFDPFKVGRHVYTFEAFCKENKDVFMDDGTTRMFLNTEGVDDIDDESRKLLDFIAGRSVDGSLARQLQEEVTLAKQNEKWRSEFMQNMAAIMDATREGRKEGELLGFEKKGIQVFLNCISRGMSEDEAKAIAGISDDLVAKAKKQV